MLLTTSNLNPCSNATAASTLSTLTNCSASIGEGCTVPPLDTTTLASCQASLRAVADNSEECYNLLTMTSAVSCRLFGSFGFRLIYQIQHLRTYQQLAPAMLLQPPWSRRQSCLSAAPRNHSTLLRPQRVTAWKTFRWVRVSFKRTWPAKTLQAIILGVQTSRGQFYWSYLVMHTKLNNIRG